MQTGFARSGKMFAIENFDVVPDIMTMAKALGNGAPISCFISTAEIADTYTKPGASTLGGNPVSTTAGLAVLDYIDEHDLCQAAYERGQQLRNGLRELATRHPVIGDVRGLGLMDGAEFIKPDGSPAPEELDNVLEIMKDRGFIIGKNGIGPQCHGLPAAARHHRIRHKRCTEYSGRRIDRAKTLKSDIDSIEPARLPDTPSAWQPRFHCCQTYRTKSRGRVCRKRLALLS